MNKIGILLINTGTPDDPTPSAVRRYLRQFLSDKHVVRIPRLIWLPILYGLILPLRPRRSAKLYQKIWTQAGSPLRSHMENIAANLQTQLNQTETRKYIVVAGMNYGQPSIATALNKLLTQKVEHIVILPLFPQYSSATTASAFDRVIKELQQWPAIPSTRFIPDYANENTYINALAESLCMTWRERPRAQHLLISFHGIPERFANSGDPYKTQCEYTAQQLALKLQLPRDQWTLCYQSRFGYDAWLKPCTQDLLKELPKVGIKEIDVICPGFATDCLETLEEIAISGKETFLDAGGKSLYYIPALNASTGQIELLKRLITESS